MKFIEEIVVDTFLPTVRSLLAEELSDRGLTQHEIANAIGVSQSAVSKYIHGDVERNPAIADNERVSARVSEIADAVAAEAMEATGVLIELEVLIRELEAPGEILATFHEEAVPELASMESHGRIHDPESRIRAEEQVRSSVRRAIRRIERTPGFGQLLPQVGTNVVEALPDATGVEDIVGIPGRIIDVEGRVAIPGEPQFGVSGHVAGVLLAAQTAGSDARAAINIRHVEHDLNSLREQGEVVTEISGAGSVPDAVEEAIRAEPTATVIAQPGAVGVEPITYLLGSEAPDVVDTAIELLEQ